MNEKLATRLQDALAFLRAVEQHLEVVSTRVDGREISSELKAAHRYIVYSKAIIQSALEGLGDEK